MKVLLLRFSSIGDIVLTTPVIRCIKKQLSGTELHYLTKGSFRPVLETNPYIGKLITFDNSTDEVIRELKKENYDLVIDLHKNSRTAKLKLQLLKKQISFNKINLEKWLAVNTRKKEFLPAVHIVDRYFSGLKKLGVSNDREGLDFYLGNDDNVTIPEEFLNGFIAFVVGAKFTTKRMPVEKMISLLRKINKPVILLGGKEDEPTSVEIKKALFQNKILDFCGKLTIRQSAYVVSQSNVVLTHDTGLMHIAAAFKKPIVSVWGNTIPEFGMYPYMPGNENLSDIAEVKNLSCRPCSKIGYASCPKGHFNCMNNQDEEQIVSMLENRF